MQTGCSGCRLLRMQTAPNASPSGLSAPDVSLSAPDVSLSAPDVSAPNLSAGAGSGVLQEQEMVSEASTPSRSFCCVCVYV